MDAFVKDRYRTWGAALGKDIDQAKVGFKQLEARALKNDGPKLERGGGSS